VWLLCILVQTEIEKQTGSARSDMHLLCALVVPRQCAGL
jgi:hypothetical protein